LESLIRGSFVYEQAKSENADLADDLIRIARQYLIDLGRRKGTATKAFAKLADATGFSSPSVDVVWRDWRTSEVRPSAWQAANIFPADGSASETLTKVVNTLKDVPEVRLGTEVGHEFSAARVARVTSSWVNGVPLGYIATREYGGDLLKCARHVYSTIINQIPWGLRAVQRIAFAGQPEQVRNELEMLPAMVYHGVRTPEAIALRMLNVPRLAAEGLAEQWRLHGKARLHEAAKWLSARGDKEWERAIPSGAAITGAECRRLWQVIEGERDWSQV